MTGPARNAARTSLEATRIRLVMELRREGITDTRVLGAIERIPREAFVPPAFHDRAYDNTALPIGEGQTISQPAVVAYMTEALAVEARMKVLEIGTGSGYQAAVLSRLCRRVYTIERHRALLAEAEERFKALRLHNITTRFGDGTKGWPEQAPFDRIIVTAAAEAIPETLVGQLVTGGIMVLPAGARPDEQRLLRVRRHADGYDVDELWPVRFVPLVPDPAEQTRTRKDRR